LLKLLQRLQEGDTLVVSELSRLTRGGSVELNKMIGDYFRPAKIRLILCNYSMEFDCANLTPMNELTLNSFAIFAKMERDSIVERSKAGLNAIKKKIASNGGFVAKRSGQWRTHLGSEKGADMTKANLASAKASTDRRLVWLMESVVGKYVQSRWQQGWSFTEILADLDRLYEISPDVYCSRQGCKIGKGQLSKMITAYKEMQGAVAMSERDRRNGGR
jgi:DNA invertase Pin-like site-specific DNA recombinase